MLTCWAVSIFAGRKEQKQNGLSREVVSSLKSAAWAFLSFVPAPGSCSRALFTGEHSINASRVSFSKQSLGRANATYQRWCQVPSHVRPRLISTIFLSCYFCLHFVDEKTDSVRPALPNSTQIEMAESPHGARDWLRSDAERTGLQGQTEPR